MVSLGKRLWIAVAVVAIAVALAACGSDGATSSESASTAPRDNVREVKFTGWEAGVDDCYEDPREESLTIGYSSPTAGNEATQAVAAAVAAEVEAWGGTAVVEDAEAQPDKQVADIERLVARKVDALIVFPLDPRALAPALKQAAAAGIPVVGIEANVAEPTPPPGFDTQVTSSLGEAGYKQAKAMAELVPEGAEIGQIELGLPVPAVKSVVAAATHYAEEFGLRPVAMQANPSDDIAGGEKAMNGLLGEAPNIAGVIAYSDETANGARAAARSQSKDPVILGSAGGALAYSSVESGAIQASTQYPVIEGGVCAVRGAYRLAQGDQVPEAVAPAEVRVIDENTLTEVPTWDEQLEEISAADS